MYNFKKKIIVTITFICVIALLYFMYTRIKPFLSGPEIVSINISNFQVIDDYHVEILAKLKYTNSISINGVQSPINELSEISHVIALVPGENSITLNLVDNFKNDREYEYLVFAKKSLEINDDVNNKEVLKEIILNNEEIISTEKHD